MAIDAASEATNSALQSSAPGKKEASAKKKPVVKNNKPKDDDKKKKVSRFFKDVKSEFKKIVWPSKQKALNNTMVVIAVMLILGAFIWILDFAFVNIFRLVFVG